MQNSAMLMTHKVRAQPSPGPGGRHRAQWRIAGPAVQRRAAGDEESREHDHEGEDGDPERQHVQNGESHVRSADLNRQEVIAEAALRRGGENEEHHDGAVHGHQCQVGFRLDVAEQRQSSARPDQVDAHQQRQKHADEHGGQRQKVILNSDDFVVEAENLLADEPLWCRVGVNAHRGPRMSRVAIYCFSASRAASHLSKSSWLTTFSMPCIL